MTTGYEIKDPLEHTRRLFGGNFKWAEELDGGDILFIATTPLAAPKDLYTLEVCMTVASGLVLAAERASSAKELAARFGEIIGESGLLKLMVLPGMLHLLTLVTIYIAKEKGWTDVE